MKPLILAVCGVLMCGSYAYAAVFPAQLRCEFRTDPLGVDSAQPRVSWILTTSDPQARGLRQTAYQILAASSSALLDKGQGDLWNSGPVKSGQSVLVRYGGKPLRSAQPVFWRVRVWDQTGKPSAWSAAAHWTMGLLQPQEWQAARWIGAPVSGAAATGDGRPYETVLLRREFAVKPGLRRAVAFVCGLGQYEMTVNGVKAGDDLLAPGWTDYKKTCLYDTRDITARLHPGPNAVGLFLGNGMYNVQGGRYTKFTGSFGPLKAIAQVRLEYKDGTTQTVSTDQTWRVASGPITFSEVYGGEDYDARRAQSGWDRPGFAAAPTTWTPAVATEGPGGTLRGLSDAAPPIKAFDTFTPVHTQVLAAGTTVYDLGQNTAVMPRVTVKGPVGSVVRILPGETLKPDGSVSQTSTGGPCYWQYTLASAGSENYFPKFFYRGARYFQVECTASAGGAELPTVESLQGVSIHADSPAVGTFASSNELFNRIVPLVRWAQQNNMVSILTDCPTRERLGWLEQDHLNGPSLRYNFDLGAEFTKIMHDMADAQLSSGLVPSIAPEYAQFGATAAAPDARNDFGDSPEWGSAYVLVAWQQYLFDGDLELLRRHYDGMSRYAAYLGSRAQGHIIDYGLGDWYDIGPKRPGRAQLTPKSLTATAIYYEDVTVLAKVARLLGNTDDGRKYETLAADIQTAFNQKFFDPATGGYSTGSQTANAMPLAVGLVEPAHQASVLAALVKDVQDRGNGLTAGDVGYRYLLRALAENGRSDVIYAMNNQSDKPGYGYQLAHGATSLTEGWAGQDSQDHFMLGQIMEWFYHDLAGIQNDGDSPGFQKITIKPALTGDLTWVKGRFVSDYGPVESAWKRENGRVTLTITIPANTTATIFVPTPEAASVTEGGKPAAQAPGIQFLRQEPNAAIYTVGAGRYAFEAATSPRSGK